MTNLATIPAKGDAIDVAAMFLFWLIYCSDIWIFVRFL
jgi:hypothetical protein